MRETIGVCRECTERHPACHDTCERYIKRKAEYEEYKSNIKRKKFEDLYLYKLNKIIDAKAKENQRRLRK